MKYWTLIATGITIAASLLFAQETAQETAKETAEKATETEAETPAAEVEAKEKAAQEGVVSLREIYNHRSDWPREIKVTKDIEGEDGFKSGDTVRLIGVTSAGVKVMKDSVRAVLPAESTSIVADIEAETGKELARVIPEPEPEPGEPGVVSASQERAIPGDELVGQDGEKFDKSSIGGKYVGIYYSAKWCPPCKAFTPSLVKFRNDNADEFEVIFVSSDRSKDAMLDYMTSYKMDFAATAFGSKMHKELQKKYAARGIPHLVIIAPDGSVVSKNGRGDISSNAKGALDDWKKAAAK